MLHNRRTIKKENNMKPRNEPKQSGGQALRKYLDDNNLTVAEFAKMVGVGVVHIYEIMAGRKMPSLKMAAKISCATGWDGKHSAAVYPEMWHGESE